MIVNEWWLRSRLRNLIGNTLWILLWPLRRSFEKLSGAPYAGGMGISCCQECHEFDGEHTDSCSLERQWDAATVIRRPRGNWKFGDVWVSWGPTDLRPSESYDFSVLVREVPGDVESDWKLKRNPTELDYRAIINGMAALLASGEKHENR